MKKTILATILTSLFAATAAHSATVVDSDGVTVDLFGEVEVQFAKDIADTYKTNDDGSKTLVTKNDEKIDVKDANIGASVGYKLTDDVTALAVFTLDTQNGDDSDDDSAQLDDAYVGFASGHYGTVTMGKQTVVYDDAGIGNDYRLGLGDFYRQNADGNQVIKYAIDKDTVYGAIAYMMNDNDNVHEDGTTVDSKVDGKIGVRFEGFDLTAFYGVQDNATGEDQKDLNLEARYTIKALTLAAAYGSMDGAVEGDAYALNAAYQLNDKVFLSTGWSILDLDGTSDKLNTYYANASYAFNSNLNTYVEVGSNDADDSEVGYVAGMVVTF